MPRTGHASHHRAGAGSRGAAPGSGFALLLLRLVLLALVLMLLHLELSLGVRLALVLILLIRFCASAAARACRADCSGPALSRGRRGRRGCSTRPELLTAVRKVASVAKGALAVLLPLHAKARLVVAGPAIVRKSSADSRRRKKLCARAHSGCIAPRHRHTCSACPRRLL